MTLKNHARKIKLAVSAPLQILFITVYQSVMAFKNLLIATGLFRGRLKIYESDQQRHKQYKLHSCYFLVTRF